MEFSGKRYFKGHGGTGDRVGETEFSGVECQTFYGTMIGVWGWGIERVPQDGGTVFTQMDAHLVCPARFKAARDEGKTAVSTPKNRIVCDSSLRRFGRMVGHMACGEFHALCRMASVGCVKRAFVRKAWGMADGPVLTMDFVA